MKKHKFKRQFAKRVFTRFHMSLILLGTILSGVIFSKILLIAGLDHMVIRFSIVLIFAYFVFFILMRIWLHYLTTPYRKRKNDLDMIDAVDLITNIPGPSTSGSSPDHVGHGGEFGGAGSSGSWSTDSGSAGIDVSEAISDTAEPVSKTAGETAGAALADIGDEGGIVLIALALLLLALFGGGIYLIYEAPVIIAEAAFELILASTIIKKAKQMDTPNWIGSVLRTTWPAFAITLSIAIVSGAVLMSTCPQAIKITEVFRYCLTN